MSSSEFTIKDTYLTLAKESEGQFSNLRSKFTAYLFPVETEEDALARVSEVKTKYYDARHHCWAYRLGNEGERFRANDDGEPSGTAGKPILGQLLSADLTNVVAIVVRYFGGVKLGTSGLIEAYKLTTAEAIANAEVKECILEQVMELSFSYDLMGEVMRYIKDADAQIYLQDFRESCRLELKIRKSNASALFQRLEQLYGCEVKNLED